MKNPMGTNAANILSLSLFTAHKFHRFSLTILNFHGNFLPFFSATSPKHSGFSYICSPFSHIIKSFKLFTKLKVAFLCASKDQIDRIEMMENEQRVLCPCCVLILFTVTFFFSIVASFALWFRYISRHLRHKTNGICFDLFTIHSSVHTNEEISFRNDVTLNIYFKRISEI